ncbi:MAG: alpha amylase C-terminal domain-containing protein [Rikenellaceae bacterium]
MKQIQLPIVASDEWLAPVSGEIEYRYERYLSTLYKIERNCGSLYDYANAHLYYGVHRDEKAKGWWVRDWLPAAREVFVFGDWNGWERLQYPMLKDEWGGWSIFLSDKMTQGKLIHGSMIKFNVHGADGQWKDRIPVYIRRVVQDEVTKDFCGQAWDCEYDWEDDEFNMNSIKSPIIYEAHIGMSSPEAKVSTYREFQDNVLPRIKELGYNTIQLMAVAEHPYYGSFGYHVSNLFAPSSRFGTPEELKDLIRAAHNMNIGVVMDLVHSHFVKNTGEGFNSIDGTEDIYSPLGEAGNQPYWDSKLYDYSKPQVRHLLLSNIKYWLEDFHFDGFRFDGVSSMLYHHHGYTDFGSYHSYFGDEVNRPAITYLTLANKLVHTVNPNAITIAEDVSGMPGMTVDVAEGGIGFDYRLAMAIPDFWIRYTQDTPDEDWDLWEMWNMMTNRLPSSRTIAYCESHDQALVGDKTLAFRLMDSAMYTDMSIESESVIVDRGLALHKMIRLFTISLGGEGYLNFMGNEFGHPEWIDFPRQDNGWSYAHARRQWDLGDAQYLKYHYLKAFDKAMISLVNDHHLLRAGYGYNLLNDYQNKTIAFEQAGLIFIFNWHPSASLADYIVPVQVAGKYKIVLNSDDAQFGGFARVDDSSEFFTETAVDGSIHLKVYNISRSVIVLKQCD